MKNLYKRFRYRNIKLIMDEGFNEYILVLDPNTVISSQKDNRCILKYARIYSEEGPITFHSRDVLK